MAHGDITHLEIPVGDMAKAAEFYSGLFGWDITEQPGYESYPMWMAPNKVSGGALVGRDAISTQPLAYVEVDSIDEVLAKAEADGATVTQPRSPIDESSWFAAFTDPDGNHIALFEGRMGG